MSEPAAFPPPVAGRVSEAAEPGWYPDPYGPPTLRWWDGSVWTPHVAGVPTLEPSRKVEAPTLPSSAAVVAVVITAASLAVSRVVLESLSSLRLPIIVYVALSAVLGYGPMVAGCVWVSRRYGTGRVAKDLGFRFRWSDAGWGPLIWMCAVAAELSLVALVTFAHIPLTSNTESIGRLRGERGVLVALLITAVVLAPLVEETVFRGVILRGLRSRMPDGAAIVVQGVLFGAAHVDPSRGMGNFGLVILLSGVGCVFGAAAHHLGRLGPTIIAHAVFNSVVMLIALNLR